MVVRSSRANAQAIIWLRSRRRWGQPELASQADVDIATLRRAEAGERIANRSLEQLAAALGVEADHVSFSEELAGGHWWVPRAPSSFFVGRDEILRQLDGALRPAEASRRVALVGVAGGGKTEIALQFVYRRQARYRQVFWIESHSEEASRESFSEVSGVLGVRPAGRSVGALARAVFETLSDTKDWLLVLDGVDSLPTWWHLLPAPRARGCVLITTTDRDLVRGRVERLNVPVLPEDDATDLLLLRGTRTELLWHRAGKRRASTAGSGPDSRRNRARPLGRPTSALESEAAATGELAQSLGCLPSALSAVGAFVSARRCSFSTYLQEHRRQFQLPVAIHSHWQRTLAALDQESPDSAKVLRLLSVSGPSMIPLSLAKVLASTVTEGQSTPLERLLRPLVRYSLLDGSVKGRYYLHPLAGESTRLSLSRDERKSLHQEFCEGMKALFPSVSLHEQSGLVSHARTSIEYGRELGDKSHSMAVLVRSVGVHCLLVGDLAHAEGYLRQAIRRLRSICGDDHPEVAKTINNLGTVYGQLGEHKKAKQRFAEAARSLTARDDTPAEVLCDANSNRAIAAMSLGEYRAAERFLRVCLQLSPQASSARYRDNLGVLCEEQGRPIEALEYYQSAIEIRRSSCSTTPLEMAHCFNNLGKLQLKLGAYEEAEEHLLEAARSWRTEAGEAHPALASTLNNLGELYLEMGRPRRAASCLEDALALRERALPEAHRHVALTLLNLARLRALSDATRKEAFGLARRARKILDEVGYHQEVAGQVRALRKLLPGRSSILDAMILAVEALSPR